MRETLGSWIGWWTVRGAAVCFANGQRCIRSAHHGSSMVRCRRRLGLGVSREACRLMPVDAASLMTATLRLPFWKCPRSTTACNE
eukprot:scaffold21354_cov19-Tisochrysis_lutea.AAC.1